MTAKDAESQRISIAAITWLVRSEYDITARLVDKKHIVIELWRNNQVIKSETVPYDIYFPDKVHAKILALYYHFNLPSKSLR